MKSARATPKRTLAAEWVIDQRDLTLAVQLLPGANLNLLRWPVAASVAYVGVASPALGLIWAMLSALVVGAFWVTLLLALRARSVRKQGSLPEDQRRVRLSVEDGTLRYQDARGQVHGRPWADVVGAVVCPQGALLRIGNQVLFVPDRALGASRDAWQEALGRVPQWTEPIGAGFTYALWVFATAMAVYTLVN